ncbi:MAG: hypothetical protein IAE83_11395 [Anaerolinea sp.]|nr:hypothetical protein [Anaerolinea sp.]CAG0989062.1 hypothetical protein ANRL4_02351 [Anaerolineae bacterium]
MTPTLRDQRAQIGALFDLNSPADAPTAYYALYHDPHRSALFTAPGGFVGRFQTGIDLFRPLVSLRCQNAENAADLLAEALIPGRPYLLFLNLHQLPLVGGSMQVSQERILSIYALNRAQFRGEINVLVKRKSTPDGTPRMEIESQGVKAVAGVNWQSPGFAEMYVQVDPEARGKGWGRSVVIACAEAILSGGRLPLYLAEPNNEASVKLAHSAGFQDTGSRQVYADALYLGHPTRKG